jgi:site-specific DNA-methyltransferase (adenine-specific)
MGYGKRLLGDCLELMPKLESGSVDMVITSPPYDNLRTYNNLLDWGEHIWKPVIQELFRVIKVGGVVVWIVGDATIKGSETGTSFKQALWAKECGFNLYDTMIYLKPSGGLPHKNRYTGAFEYMFVWSKGIPVTFNPICDRYNKSSGRETGSKTVRELDGTLTKRKSITIKEFGNRFNYWEYYNGRGVGQTDPIAYQHPATFPEQLATDHIISWSNESDIILDPFAGSFTTAIACINTNRQYICIEKDPTYFQIGADRIRNHLIKLGKIEIVGGNSHVPNR